MTKEITLTAIITLIFLALVGIFEFIHMQMKADVVAVPTEYLQPLDVTLKTDFLENLRGRQGNVLGPDLGY
jgi:hypothetical protein